MTERQFQAQVFNYLRLALPTDAIPYTIPNGDGRMTTAPGTLTGMPDLGIVYQGRAIFIELKTKRGAVRPAQRWVHERLTTAGAVVAVCRTLDEVEGFLAMLMPLRARVRGAA